jgi:hypothetical protein
MKIDLQLLHDLGMKLPVIHDIVEEFEFRLSWNDGTDCIHFRHYYSPCYLR